MCFSQPLLPVSTFTFMYIEYISMHVYILVMFHSTVVCVQFHFCFINILLQINYWTRKYTIYTKNRKKNTQKNNINWFNKARENWCFGEFDTTLTVRENGCFNAQYYFIIAILSVRFILLRTVIHYIYSFWQFRSHKFNFDRVWAW